MEPRILVVLIDGEPEDAALVSRAREYADAKDCSVTLLQVVPEVTRGRIAGGVVILPWQIMQAMEAEAKYQLESLRARFLRGRAHPNTKLVRFGRVHDEVAAVIDGVRTAGARALFLEVGADNPPARALYEAMGFRVIGARAAYYRRGDGPPADALIMRLSLK